MKVVQALLDRGDEVVGIDDLADPHDVALKYARLARHSHTAGFRFIKLDVADRPALSACFAEGGFDQVVHLAVPALEGRVTLHDRAGAAPGLVGFINVLEGCRREGVRHVVYASAANGSGARRGLRDAGLPSDLPLQPNERLAQCYGRLHGLATTGLRFFNVYGATDRSIAAATGVSRALVQGQLLPALQQDSHLDNDLGDVEDIVRGILRALTLPSVVRPGASGEADPLARVLSVGSRDPVRLLDFVAALEQVADGRARWQLPPIQPGSSANEESGGSGRLVDLVGGARATMPLAEGVQRFVSWYLAHHGLRPSQEPVVKRRAVLFDERDLSRLPSPPVAMPASLRSAS